MTDQELDALMKRVLVDSMKLDLEADTEDNMVRFNPSSRYQRQMRTMLKDPLGWSRKKSPPVWRKIAQKVAIVLLVISVGFGMIMVVSPTARAAFIRWVTEWYETHVVFRYAGSGTTEIMPCYEITELSEGFKESERIEFPGLTSVTYENETGNVIYFNYIFMAQGAANDFDTENADVYDIAVNHMNGLFFKSKVPDNFNTITWIDTKKNIQFDISGRFDYMAMLHIAESVSLVETTK